MKGDVCVLYMYICIHTQNRRLVELDIFIVSLLTKPDFEILI